LAVVALASLAAGCGSGSGSTAATQGDSGSSAPHTGTVKVVMQTLAFEPASIHAGVGQTVVWTNEDNVPHNVIYVSGPRFTSSRPRIKNGTKFSIKLTQAGTIHYYCSIHPWMKGTIAVAQ
jgi:plastocyanin